MGDRYDNNAYDSLPYQEGSTQPPLYGSHAGASAGGRMYPPSRDDGETQPYGGARPVLNESDYGQAGRAPSSYGRSARGEGSYGQPPRASYGVQAGNSLSTPSYGGGPQPPPPPPYGGGPRPPLPYVTLPDSGHESAQPQSGSYGGEPPPLKKPYPPPYDNQEPAGLVGQTKPEFGYGGGRGIRPQPPYENQEAGRGGSKPQLPQPYPPYGIQHPNEDSFSSGGLGRGRGGGGGVGSQLAPAADPYGRGYGRGQNPTTEYATIRPSSFGEEVMLPAPISSEVAHETYASVFADPVYGGARDYNPEGGYSEEPESSRLAHYQQDLKRQNDLK